MKTLLSLVILGMIAAAGYYFYQQNIEQLNKTIDTVKNASVESVSDAVMEKVTNIDTEQLLELAVDNKDELLKLMEKNDISLENIDLSKLKEQLEAKGLSLEAIDLNDVEYKEQLKEIFESAKNKE